jgi:hypothetical protein
MGAQHMEIQAGEMPLSNHQSIGPIPPEATSPESTVVVAGASITMQQLQQIYAELTGKSETISKYYNDPIRLTFDDIEQLHHRVVQTWEQYRVVSSSCSFTIYYLKNTKDLFNTFERAKFQIGGGADPIESLLIKYDFLVLLPNVDKPQTYSISVRVVSRLVLEKKMQEDIPIVSIPPFFRLMAHGIGRDIIR